MSVAYGLISRELYRGMQFELEQKTGQCGKPPPLSQSLSLFVAVPFSTDCGIHSVFLMTQGQSDLTPFG